jgi:hypothetical protein
MSSLFGPSTPQPTLYQTLHPSAAKPQPVSKKTDKTPAIKIATSNLFDLNPSKDNASLLFNLELDYLGGQDIINFLRTDTVNGAIQDNVIKGISEINQNYGSLNIFKLQNIESEYFDNFDINLLDHIPDPVNDLSINEIFLNSGTNYYIDNYTGQITFYFINLNNQKIEIEFLQVKSNLNSTIFSS